MKFSNYFKNILGLQFYLISLTQANQDMHIIHTKKMSFGPEASSKHLYPPSLVLVDFLMETFLSYSRKDSIMEGSRDSRSF